MIKQVFLCVALLSAGCGFVNGESLRSLSSTFEATFDFELKGINPAQISNRYDFQLSESLAENPDFKDQLDQIQDIESLEIVTAVYNISENDTQERIPSLRFVIVPFGAATEDQPIVSALLFPIPAGEQVNAGAIVFEGSTTLPESILETQAFSAYILGNIPEDVELFAQVVVTFRITVKVKVKVT